MNLLQGLVTGALAFVLPLVPTPAEAPEPYTLSASARFYLVGEKGFSFRWVDEETSINEGLECNLYAWCACADIVGPVCADEVAVELDYFDEDDWYVTTVIDVLPSAGCQRHIRVELGTNLYNGLASFQLADIKCYRGLPTGTPNI